MSDGMRATVVSAYPFHMVDQARQVSRLGALERMVTAIPLGRVGLPREQVRRRIYGSGLRYVVGKAFPGTDQALTRGVVRDFDRWAIRQIGTPTVVNALSGFATKTLEEAAHQGIGVCCDRGSWHILEQKQVLEDEADRMGCGPPRFDPFVIDRELCEYDLVDRIIVPSEPARQSFLRRGISCEKIAKVPYGVDISSFSLPTSQREPGAIVSVGTVGMRKGQHYVAEAFRSLATNSATLTLVGPIDPGWEERLNLGRGDIRTTGAVPRSRVIEELQRASLFVLASIEEGLALVLAQAMACGLPVVATESTGVRELVTDGIEGLIVPPGDTQALTRAFEELIADPERAAEMGAAGRRRVEAFGGWDRYGAQIVEVFEAVHEERG